MKVFGVGYHKTGTTTLRACLEELGFSHVGYRRDLLRKVERGETDEVVAVMDRYDSCQDWPWALLFRELDRRYPDARFVLTTRRDSATWLDSLRKHAARKGPSEARRIVYGHAMPDGAEALHVERYEAHNRAVREWFADRPDRLLEVCWETGSGWAELCGFLGRPVPDAPLPHRNARPGPWQRAARGGRRLLRRLRRGSSSGVG